MTNLYFKDPAGVACHLCEYVPKSSSGLDKHLKSHRGMLYTCCAKGCPYKNTSLSMFRKHVDTEHPERADEIKGRAIVGAVKVESDYYMADNL